MPCNPLNAFIEDLKPSNQMSILSSLCKRSVSKISPLPPLWEKCLLPLRILFLQLIFPELTACGAGKRAGGRQFLPRGPQVCEGKGGRRNEVDTGTSDPGTLAVQGFALAPPPPLCHQAPLPISVPTCFWAPAPCSRGLAAVCLSSPVYPTRYCKLMPS